MHFLITGHTGFKGSWLSLMLKNKGFKVSGISLNPDGNSLFIKAKLGEIFQHDIRMDIREFRSLKEKILEINPDVLIHLAAQSLVIKSYNNPQDTYETNVLGTLNVLEAGRNLKNLKAQLIVTTDKVYENNPKLRGYREEDKLGGSDPYSKSKSLADEITQLWMREIDNVPTGIARAGNVIGGGDFSENRLVPDLIKAFLENEKPIIRNPHSIRPWQHVLDCLNGYLSFVDYLLLNQKNGIFNFGPNQEDIHKVESLVKNMAKHFNQNGEWIKDNSISPKEAEILILNSEKAKNVLNWEDKLDFEATVKWTSNWYKSVNKENNYLEATIRDIKEFDNLK